MHWIIVTPGFPGVRSCDDQSATQLASGSAMARSQQRSRVWALRYSAYDSILMEWVLATLAMMISDRSDRTAES